MPPVIQAVLALAVVAVVLWLDIRASDDRERTSRLEDEARQVAIAASERLPDGVTRANLTLVSPGTYQVVAAKVIRDELGLSFSEAWSLAGTRDGVILTGDVRQVLRLARDLREQGAVVTVEPLSA